MPSPLLHIGFNVSCSHGGRATPVANPRVLISGQATVTIGAPYAVVGCGFVPPGGNGPCAKGEWLVGTVRVTSGGLPLAILTGTSTCTPTATPLVAVPTQPPRVLAT